MHRLADHLFADWFIVCGNESSVTGAATCFARRDSLHAPSTINLSMDLLDLATNTLYALPDAPKALTLDAFGIAWFSPAGAGVTWSAFAKAAGANVRSCVLRISHSNATRPVFIPIVPPSACALVIT